MTSVGPTIRGVRNLTAAAFLQREPKRSKREVHDEIPNPCRIDRTCANNIRFRGGYGRLSHGRWPSRLPLTLAVTIRIRHSIGDGMAPLGSLIGGKSSAQDILLGERHRRLGCDFSHLRCKRIIIGSDA
jgi:hypothetical protein